MSIATQSLRSPFLCAGYSAAFLTDVNLDIHRLTGASAVHGFKTKLLLSAALLTVAGAIGCGGQPGEEQPQADRFLAPEAPSGEGQGSFIRFESGLSGTAHLPSGRQPECLANSEGARAFRASTTDFADFDTGSAFPGEDFTLELLVDSGYISNAAGEQSNYLSLQYVDHAGTHHDLFALDELDIHVVDADVVGAGFTATAREIEPESAAEVTVTGFIRCSSVTDVTGPV